MITGIKGACAVAALLVATSVPAQTQSTFPGTAASRIEAAFDVVAAMPPTEPVSVPMAVKGDLPVPLGCIGLQADEQAECMDVAYEVPSEPGIVVETRFGNTSILTRTNTMTAAGGPVDEGLAPQSE